VLPPRLASELDPADRDFERHVGRLVQQRNERDMGWAQDSDHYVYARRGQVFDLYNITAAVFSGQNAALERAGNYLICLMVHCRYRT
jgi:hypothetical protein